MIIKTEEELISLGEQIGQNLLQQAGNSSPLVVELVGDVGAGKTTLTKGIAKGLKIDSAITSPSFTISKRYKNNNIELVHYDFYRLEDPGLMAEDLEDTMSSNHTVAVIEWGDSIESLLPENHPKITIALNDDETRTVKIENLALNQGEPQA